MANTPARLTSLRKTPLTGTQAKLLRNSIIEARMGHERYVKDQQALIDRKRDQLDQMVADFSPQRRSTVRKEFAAEHKSFAADIIAKSAETRVKHLRELQGMVERIKAAGTFLSDPRQIASAHKLGTQERALMEAQIAPLMSSPGTVRTLAQRALAMMGDGDEGKLTEGRLMASVLAGHVERMPTSQRPLDPNELAQAAHGEEATAVTAMVKESELCLQMALAVERGFEHQKPVSGDAHISEGLARREIDTAAIEAIDESVTE